jgi:hypothetical protein
MWFRSVKLFTIPVVITKYSLRPSHYLQTVLLSSTVCSCCVGFFFFFFFIFCALYGSSGLFSSRINLLNIRILQMFCGTNWTRGTGPSLHLYLYKTIFVQREKDMDTLPFSKWDCIPWFQDSACPRRSDHYNWLLFNPSRVVSVSYFRHNPSLHGSHRPTIPTFVFVLFQCFVRHFTAVASLLQNTWTQPSPVLWYEPKGLLWVTHFVNDNERLLKSTQGSFLIWLVQVAIQWLTNGCEEHLTRTACVTVVETKSVCSGGVDKVTGVSKRDSRWIYGSVEIQRTGRRFWMVLGSQHGGSNKEMAVVWTLSISSSHFAPAVSL